MELSIDRVWDGGPAARDEIARVRVVPQPEGLSVTVDAPFHHDPAPSSPPGPHPALWEHEVVELFVVGPSEHYFELELGPHGHHLALGLEGRRRVVRSELTLDYRAERTAERWSGAVVVPWSYLPSLPWSVNAYAIHGVATKRRYLAWSPVPGDRPDFHRLEFFRPVDLAPPPKEKDGRSE